MAIATSSPPVALPEHRWERRLFILDGPAGQPRILGASGPVAHCGRSIVFALLSTIGCVIAVADRPRAEKTATPTRAASDCSEENSFNLIIWLSWRGKIPGLCCVFRWNATERAPTRGVAMQMAPSITNCCQVPYRLATHILLVPVSQLHSCWNPPQPPPPSPPTYTPTHLAHPQPTSSSSLMADTRIATASL